MEFNFQKTETDINLDKLELRALSSFNKCCMEIRGDYEETSIGLLQIRVDAYKLFCEKFRSASFKRLLISALLFSRKHWKKALTDIEEIDARIFEIFKRLSDFGLLEDVKYKASPISSYYSTDKLNEDCCIIHPNRKAYNKKRKLCNSCLQKLYRLNLENYPIDYGLIYVLKTRAKKTSPFKFCINHPRKLALGNGLCDECNRRIGVLSDLVEKSTENDFAKIKGLLLELKKHGG